ncbi:hypothetical protein VQ03_03255 [Methylobacterium tarhaniae]|uniref:Uncharacterized protein n=1 Tax=Methylobacterium tarhaniae TaxID=1187852 RepID=A0A0J6TES2_9HYPH|nr:hypothetical protein [Methylobacterium tarhaniae]KMO44409.1 hypothetical protein VQ03_03255 [Methylobacterium tarhaniae]
MQDDPNAPAAPEPAPVAAPLAEQIDRLHHDTFAGTALGHHTDLWNLVHAFKERVKALVVSG